MSKDEEITDYESFMNWARGLCLAIDQLEVLIFEKDSPGARFQERCVHAARIFRSTVQQENDHAVVLHQTTPDFKRGYRFAINCLIDLFSNKRADYQSIDEVLCLLRSLLLLGDVNDAANCLERDKKS